MLAEVSAARTLGKFKVEDLPVQPITMRPMIYQPKENTKAQDEHEEFLKHIDMPDKSSGMQVRHPLPRSSVSARPCFAGSMLHPSTYTLNPKP